MNDYSQSIKDFPLPTGYEIERLMKENIEMDLDEVIELYKSTFLDGHPESAVLDEHFSSVCNEAYFIYVQKNLEEQRELEEFLAEIELHQEYLEQFADEEVTVDPEDFVIPEPIDDNSDFDESGFDEVEYDEFDSNSDDDDMPINPLP